MTHTEQRYREAKRLIPGGAQLLSKQQEQYARGFWPAYHSKAKGCEAAGITADMSNEEICEKLVAQFTSMEFTGLTGTGMTWNANGEVSKVPHGMIIKDGVYVGVED